MTNQATYTNKTSVAFMGAQLATTEAENDAFAKFWTGVRKGKYNTLNPGEASLIRDIYMRHPLYVTAMDETPGREWRLPNGTVFGKASRIVVGNHGLYVEFKPEDLNLFNPKAPEHGKLILDIKEGQEYRLQPKYSNVKYHWYVPNKYQDIKVYRQQNTVAYADYIVGCFYVSIDELEYS